MPISWGVGGGANLDRLALGQKIKWVDGNLNALVELWGEIVPLGVETLTGFDQFTTDSLTAGDWSALANLSVVGGKLQGASLGSGRATQWVAKGTSTNPRRIRAKSTVFPKASDRIVTPLVGYLDANNYIGGIISFVDANTCPLRIVKYDGGVMTTLATGTTKTAAQIVAGEWTVDTSINGNIVTINAWRPTDNPDSDPPFMTATHTLITGNAAKFGAGVATSVGLGFWETGTNDDVTLWEQLPEQHNLMSAITPSQGARTVRKLYGSTGALFTP